MDPFDLERFRAAQEGVFETARAELRAGAKRSHWMWFIFPQLRGLGMSATAQRYGIGSLEEARAYLAHKVLGARLREAFETVLAHEGRSAHAIFGSPDDLKLRSSATLFALVDDAPSPFTRALDRFFDGQADTATLALLRRS